MRPLLRAIVQLVAEINIYAWERVLEHLAVPRPNIDDPLPAGYTPIDDSIDRKIPELTGHRVEDFTGYTFTPQEPYEPGPFQ